MNVFKISNSERKVSKKIYINIMGKKKKMNFFIFFFSFSNYLFCSWNCDIKTKILKYDTKKESDCLPQTVSIFTKKKIKLKKRYFNNQKLLSAHSKRTKCDFYVRSVIRLLKKKKIIKFGYISTPILSIWIVLTIVKSFFVYYFFLNKSSYFDTKAYLILVQFVLSV